MNSETDRIAVPTNGRKPRAVPGGPTLPPVAAAEASDDPGQRGPRATVTSSPELTVAVTPAQLAVGFGVIAGIILLVLGRRRGRRRG